MQNEMNQQHNEMNQNMQHNFEKISNHSSEKINSAFKTDHSGYMK